MGFLIDFWQEFYWKSTDFIVSMCVMKFWHNITYMFMHAKLAFVFQNFNAFNGYLSKINKLIQSIEHTYVHMVRFSRVLLKGGNGKRNGILSFGISELWTYPDDVNNRKHISYTDKPLKLYLCVFFSNGKRFFFQFRTVSVPYFVSTF